MVAINHFGTTDSLCSASATSAAAGRDDRQAATILREAVAGLRQQPAGTDDDTPIGIMLHDLRNVTAGATPQDIIYANPCKSVSHVAFAHHRSVLLTTFDCIAELDKLARFPGMRLVLRIAYEDPTAAQKLGNIYGAMEHEVEPLAVHAKALGLDIVGVSFHIGSGSQDSTAYVGALHRARQCWGVLLRHGFQPYLLDVGGGFLVSNHTTGLGRPSLPEHCAHAVKLGLRAFDDVPGEVQVIAEPGRYFAEAYGAYAVQVINVRDRDGERTCFLSDGLWGNLRIVGPGPYHIAPERLVCHAAARVDSQGDPCGLSSGFESEDTARSNSSSISSEDCVSPTDPQLVTTNLMGPTLTGVKDMIRKGVMMPRLEVGDWVLFRHVGAYNMVAASGFNGICVEGKTMMVYVD